MDFFGTYYQVDFGKSLKPRNDQQAFLHLQLGASRDFTDRASDVCVYQLREDGKRFPLNQVKSHGRFYDFTVPSY